MEAEKPDVLCLQEHKLQDVHVEEHTKKLRELLPGKAVQAHNLWLESTTRFQTLIPKRITVLSI